MRPGASPQKTTRVRVSLLAERHIPNAKQKAKPQAAMDPVSQVFVFNCFWEVFFESCQHGASVERGKGVCKIERLDTIPNVF